MTEDLVKEVMHVSFVLSLWLLLVVATINVLRPDYDKIIGSLMVATVLASSGFFGSMIILIVKF